MDGQLNGKDRQWQQRKNLNLPGNMKANGSPIPRMKIAPKPANVFHMNCVALRTPSYSADSVICPLAMSIVIGDAP